VPASSGLRSRPQIGIMRSISTQRTHASTIAHILPKTLILPILLAAVMTVATATAWTYGIHKEAALAAADDTVTTGTATKSN
jgi:hypothetical protein